MKILMYYWKWLYCDFFVYALSIIMGGLLKFSYSDGEFVINSL